MLFRSFQPEEETFVGAKNMVNSSQFSEMNIDEIYALHVTALPVGQIMVKPNELYAYQKRIQIKFNDKFSKENAGILYNQIRSEILRKKDGANPWEIPKAFDSIIGLSNPNGYFGLNCATYIGLIVPVITVQTVPLS